MLYYTSMVYVDHMRGRASEDTALEYFQNQDFAFIARNFSISGIEVDLIFKKEDVYYIVEVKSENIWRMDRPVNHKQMKRLKKAAEILSEGKQSSVRLFVAIVQNTKVEVYSLDDV